MHKQKSVLESLLEKTPRPEPEPEASAFAQALIALHESLQREPPQIADAAERYQRRRSHRTPRFAAWAIKREHSELAELYAKALAMLLESRKIEETLRDTARLVNVRERFHKARADNIAKFARHVEDVSLVFAHSLVFGPIVARKRAGKNAGDAAKAQAQERHDELLVAAQKLRDNGTELHNLSSVLAERNPECVKTIRKALQDGGLLPRRRKREAS